MKKVLHVFRHGLGDAVQFSVILKHLAKQRPDEAHTVASLKGKESTFHDPCHSLQIDRDNVDESKFDEVKHHQWPECGHTYGDSPSTKAALCLRDLGLSPDWNEFSYTIHPTEEAHQRAEAFIKTLPLEGKRGFIALHYEGNTSAHNKNLKHSQAKELCQFFAEHGFLVVLLDWDRRSPLADNHTIFNPDTTNAIWQNTGTGDAGTLAALIQRAKLFVGIDSGPQKVALATSTPAICVWTGHHPIHYVDRTDNATHVIPWNHADLIRGDKDQALRYFNEHYRSVLYTTSPVASVCKQAAKLLNINVMARPELLQATGYDLDYYQEHKLAGLDYGNYGDWQANYGKWLVSALNLGGKTVLDVGCACGMIAAGLAHAGAFVSGIDLCEPMVQIGRQKWPGFPLYICDAVNCHHWKDNTFDLVHHNQVAEHWKPELVPFILQELRRITRPQGLMFAVFDTEELFARQGRKESVNEDPTHCCIKPLAWWQEQLRASGWQEEPTIFDQVKTHPDSYFKQYDWEGFVARKV